MNTNTTTMYTKEQNKKCGRKGYGMWKREKEDVIPPKKYGEYISRKKNKK